MLALLSITIFAAALAAAAATDLLRYEIPDSLSVAVVAAFALTVPALPAAASAWHVAAFLAVLGATALLFFAGICGGGDVKLLAAASLWMGWANLAAFLLLTALAGAVLALALLIARRAVARPVEANRWYSRLLSETEGVPYGVAIAAAGLVSLLHLSVVEPAAM